MQTKQNERERLQALSAAQWERERQRCADAYAAVLTHLRAAAEAVPHDGGVGTRLGSEIVYLSGNARGSLRRVLDETNPFVESGERA